MRKPLKIFQISAQGFYRSKNNWKWVLLRAVFDSGTAQTAHFQAMWIISKTSRHPKDVPFVGQFWLGTYSLDPISPWKKNKFRRSLPSTFCWVMTQK